ncbi:hypothetical protein ACT29H_03585 [Thermophagus sp. OGC60D27]|uniref:hypothetical protein n=1 Tax=Thermophagus sp. OGC60D27 TaxID=3458415 RepID=UPI0040376390
MAEELNQVRNIRLKPERLAFQQSDSLLKCEADLMEIPYSDFLLIKQMEDGLSESEKKDLDKLVVRDDRLIKKGLQFHNTRLSVQPIPYPWKENLLRKQILPHFKLFIRSVAAAVILIMLFWGYRFLNIWDVNQRQMPMVSMKPLTNIQLPEVGMDDQLFVEEAKTFEGAEDANTKHPENFKLHRGISGEKRGSGAENLLIAKGEDLVLLEPISLKKDIKEFVVNIPNAYEAGLRHMMPMYLDIHNNRLVLMAQTDNPVDKQNDEGILFKGLQLFDKVGGKLIQFQPVYDDEGNFIAYNFKAGSIEMAQKIRR